MAESVILITGADNGIGFHLAASLLEEGYRVAGIDLSAESLISLQEDYPDRLLFCRCDVTDDAQVQAAVELAPYGICVNLVHPPLTDTRSAAPLGIPPQAMADPAQVGRALAKKILSTRPVVTPDLKTAAYLFLARRYPERLGRLFAKLASNGRPPQGEGRISRED
jgi:NAD(P)-dependent dehydrogenase (short-subunit alcohol dehydrogenase family)